MKSANSNSFSPALILILGGVFTYIAVDSGIISWVRPVFQTAKVNEGTPSPGESLAQYSGKIHEELKEVESAVHAHKSQLQDMQKQMSDYEKSLAVQRSNLRELDDNIRNLRKLQKADSPGTAERGPATNRIFSVGDVESQVRSLGINATIEPITLASRTYLRLNAPIRFDSERTIYLARVGIAQVKTFVLGMASLGYDQVTLAYDDQSDQMNLERLDVLKRYISETAGKRVAITTQAIKRDEGLAMPETPEIWVNKRETP